jgi:hypothetical protein
LVVATSVVVAYFAGRWSSGVRGRTIGGCRPFVINGFVGGGRFNSRWSSSIVKRTIRDIGGSCTSRWSRSGSVTGRGL